MWRELYGRNIASVDIEPIGDEPFHASVTFQGLPGVGLVRDRDRLRTITSRGNILPARGTASDCRC